MQILIVKRVSLIVARIDPLWSGIVDANIDSKKGVRHLVATRVPPWLGIVDGNIDSQKGVTQCRVEESLDSY